MPITPQVIDETSDKKYFSIIPHYITNHSSHWEQSLYLQMKRVSGETGKCFVSQKGLAKRMGCSQQTVSKVLRKLVKRGWIKQEGFVPGKTRPVKRWTLVDLWKFNNNHYKKIDSPQSISPKKTKDSVTTEYKIHSPGSKEEEHKIRRKITLDNTKVIAGGKPQRGNPEVNRVIDFFKEKMKLPMLDGSIEQNRRYSWLLLKKFGGLNGVLKLISYASKDRFWRDKITSTQRLYYKGVEIIAKKRGEGDADSKGGVDASNLGD